MAGKRNPSGLPSSRVAKPVYGPREIDVYQRVGNQHQGFLRVRRSLLRATAVVLVLIVLGAMSGGAATAAGVAMVLLAPLVLFLAGLEVAIFLTRPKELDGGPVER